MFNSIFAKNRRSRCCSSRRSSPAILCWTCWSSAFGSSPKRMILYVCGSRPSRSTFGFVLAYCILRLDCGRKYSRYSVIHGVVTDFPVTFRIARWFPWWSCFLALWILWTTLRVRFQHDSWRSRSSAHLLVELILSFHTYRFLNARCKQCVPENDCMWPVLVKPQAFLLSELQIAPKYCISKASPSFLVWRDPWFRKIAWSFLHALFVFHRVHCSEEDRLSSSLEASSFLELTHFLLQYSIHSRSRRGGCTR